MIIKEILRNDKVTKFHDGLFSMRCFHDIKSFISYTRIIQNL